MTSNSKKTVGQRNVELERVGRKIIDLAPESLVSMSSYVNVQCLNCRHVANKKLANFRGRKCGICGGGSSYGERILYVLLKHYIDGKNDWVAEWEVAGLDNNNPSLKFRFDFASNSRKIAFEVHSEYHYAPHKLFSRKIDYIERARRDRLKTINPNGGVHKSGPMAGWQVVVIDFGEIFKLNDGDYIPAVIDKFKKVCMQTGLQLRGEANEIKYSDIYSFIYSPNVTDAIELGFELQDDYRGGGVEYQWLHLKCGKSFKACASQMLSAVFFNNKTGCNWCDKVGRPGEFLKFLERIENKDLYVDYSVIDRVYTQEEIIPSIHCRKHKEEIIEFTRAYWTGYYLNDRHNSFVCKKCKYESVSKSRSHEQWSYDFKRLGFELINSEAPGRKSMRNKQIPTKGTLRCHYCKNEFTIINPPARIKKAKISLYKGGEGLSCPQKKCANHIKKGPKPKVNKLR